LPNTEDDYLDACREFCSILYSRAIEGSGKRYFLDKSPNYADTILPFVEKLLPKAKFIILTRHPLALLSSAVHTFFGGDYDRSYYNRNILGTFIPSISNFIQHSNVPFIHVNYEELVSNPDRQVRLILDFLELDFEPECINFGKKSHINKTYGDPKIGRHEKPVTESVQSWVRDFIYRPDRRRLCENILRGIPESDLKVYGYPMETIWKPLQQVRVGEVQVDAERHTLRTRIISIKWMVVRFFQSIATRPGVVSIIKKIRKCCDVLLRNEKDGLSGPGNELV